MRDEVMEVVRGHFRPEFLNRLDEILLFHRLGRDQMSIIVQIQLERLRKMLEDRKIALSIDGDAMAWLADKGYDPVYGARPLKARHPARVAKSAWHRSCWKAELSMATRSMSAWRTGKLIFGPGHQAGAG